MKFLFINSVAGIGSTGRIVAEICRSLQQQGHQCVIAYGRDKANCDDIETVCIGSPLDYKIHGVLNRITDRHGFYSRKATGKFLNWVREYDPDVVWLHNIHGYYRTLEDSEISIKGENGDWLDLSPFVSYMLETFEQCLIDAALSNNKLTPNEQKLLDRMNRVKGIAQITTKNAAKILGNSESAARNTLRSLVNKGYLRVNMEEIPFVYTLDPNMPDEV